MEGIRKHFVIGLLIKTEYLQYAFPINLNSIILCPPNEPRGYCLIEYWPDQQIYTVSYIDLNNQIINRPIPVVYQNTTNISCKIMKYIMRHPDY